MHDNRLRMLQDDEPPKFFMETTEEHKVLRPVKRAKTHESHTVSEEGPLHGKIGPTESRGVEGMYQNSRCASREKTWVQSTKKLNENWDAISLVFVSAVLRNNFSSFRSTLHNFSHTMLLNVWDSSLLRSKGKVQNWVRRRSYYLNLCEADGLKTWGQLPHLINNGRKFSTMRRTSCSSLSRVLSTRSSCTTSPTSPASLSQDCENFLMCPATTRSYNMSEQAQGDLLQTQSQDDEQAGGGPLPPELPWGKV